MFNGIHGIFKSPNGPNDYMENKKKRPLLTMIIPAILLILIIFITVSYSNRISNNQAKEEMEIFIEQLENHIRENVTNIDQLFSSTTLNNKYDILGTHYTRAEIKHTEFFKHDNSIDGNQFVYFAPEEKFEVIINRTQNGIQIIGYVFRSRHTVNKQIPIT